MLHCFIFTGSYMTQKHFIIPKQMMFGRWKRDFSLFLLIQYTSSRGLRPIFFDALNLVNSYNRFCSRQSHHFSQLWFESTRVCDHDNSRYNQRREIASLAETVSFVSAAEARRANNYTVSADSLSRERARTARPDQFRNCIKTELQAKPRIEAPRP